MDGFLAGLLVSFGVIFVAELGDKSQLMALTFAARYRTMPVLVGITLATSVVHAISVAVGYGLGATIPTGWVALVAAVAFLAFGAWTLRGDRLSAAERAKVDQSTRSAVFAASAAFFLAELGDKTMLATITLATQHGWFGTWLGSTLGMVAADALAIVVGRQLGRRLPERAVKVGAAVLFFVFGAWLGVDATERLAGRDPVALVAAGLDHHTAGWITLGLAVVLLVLAGLRRPSPAHSVPVVIGGRRAKTRTRALFVAATVLGLPGPILVGIDVVQPIALLDNPGVVATGAAFALLGLAVVLASRSADRKLDRTGFDQTTATTGVYARIRHPAATGAITATAGLLLMTPTATGVLAAVLILTATQLHIHTVREPDLAELHGAHYDAYAARTGRLLPKITEHSGAGRT